MMLSRWNELERRTHENTIEDSKAEIGFNKIQSSFLEALDKLDD